MDIHNRIQTAEQASDDLRKSFNHIDHRIHELEIQQKLFNSLHAELEQLRSDMVLIKEAIEVVQNSLPNVARAEEMERLQKHVDDIPFELLATKKDLHYKKITRS